MHRTPSGANVSTASCSEEARRHHLLLIGMLISIVLPLAGTESVIVIFFSVEPCGCSLDLGFHSDMAILSPELGTRSCCSAGCVGCRSPP